MLMIIPALLGMFAKQNKQKVKNKKLVDWSVGLGSA